MMDGKGPEAAELLYYGRHLRSSLGWLSLALFFGGVPLIVYFTTPEPPLATLVLAALLGLPLFVMSLRDLGESTALLLLPGSRRLRYVEGFFRRRIQVEHRYEDVHHLELVARSIDGHRRPSSGWNEIHIILKPKGEIVLEESTYDRARHGALHMAALLGVDALYNGKPIELSIISTMKSPHLTPTDVAFRIILYLAVASVLALSLGSMVYRFVLH